jgi:8-oxo-dGTP pyrophosphatase MutT (NUDIX family)
MEDDAPDLTAGVIVFDNAMNFLLVKQRKNGIWSFPKGSVKYGETMFDGALREAFEETGIDFSSDKYISIYIDMNYNKKLHLYIYKSLMNYKSIPVKTTQDTCDYIWLNWFNLSEKFMKENRINKITMNYLMKSFIH